MSAVTATHGVHRVARDHCLAPSRTADAPTGGARYGRMFPGLPVLPGDTALRNARAPKLDLEMVYGDGPVGHPYLYDVTDPARLLLGADCGDVPRNSQGVALIGDPRDDVHLFINQLHVALLHAHNGLVERLRTDGVGDDTVFDEARRALTWHYQWVVARDLLPRVVGAELVDDVLGHGGRWFAPKPGEAFLPLEFADAAYRYGHGQIRHTYQLTEGGDAVPLFPDLVGFGPVPCEHRLDLGRIIDLPGRPAAQRAKRLDGTLPASLIGLPPQVTGEVGGSWPEGTPLWFYVLREAAHRGAGERLGPVGGRIVAEVLIGLLRADPGSYLVVDPAWAPTLPRAGDRFGLADLLVFAEAQADTSTRG